MVEWQPVWLIEITAGHMTLYYYEQNGMYGWTSIANHAKRFLIAKHAHEEVQHTTGYDTMRITEHLFAS